MSLYYIFASRTRVPILVRATILVTILQWPSYSICPATAVLFHLSDYNRLPYNDGLAPLSLHNRFHFAVSTVAGDYENENSIIITLPIKFYSTMPRWLDFSFYEYDSIRLEGSVLARSPLLPREVELREEETLHVQSTFLIRCRRKKGRNGTRDPTYYATVEHSLRSSSWLCQPLLLFISRRSIPFPFVVSRTRWPTSRSYYRCPKECRGGGGERMGDGIVFCAVRSILRRRRHSASRTCMCTRIIGNVLGGVLDSPRSNVRVYVGNLSPKLLSVPSSCKNCKIRAALRVYYRSDHFWIKWKSNSNSMNNIGGLCSKIRVYLGIVFLDMEASLYSSIV